MRMRKFERGTPITVWWRDIVDDNAWKKAEDVEKGGCALMITRGFFLANNKRKSRTELAMAPTIEHDLSQFSLVYIPWGCIERVTKDGSRIQDEDLGRFEWAR